ncbi:hypothetical protein FZC84_00855 [Rossellomorea vietnamensis]|uniref:Uncharacterized protein n=1 Tax=Rossellomorea vietnamensis TaxID=218284 RepID=A0A5D4MH80_9BACI|nr:hypothetical protein [Rossellomorea vietnamensis]TYS01245.1 hypothetical protein FZC84_00855 [Rossellomorea vietnamensis]
MMKEKQKGNPFVLYKPSGTVPKRSLKDNQLLILNNKVKEQLNKLKQGRRDPHLSFFCSNRQRDIKKSHKVGFGRDELI